MLLWGAVASCAGILYGCIVYVSMFAHCVMLQRKPLQSSALLNYVLVLTTLDIL